MNLPNPSSSTSLAPEQAQRLAMKLVKRFPALLEGLEEHVKAMVSGPNAMNWGDENASNKGYNDQDMYLQVLILIFIFYNS